MIFAYNALTLLLLPLLAPLLLFVASRAKYRRRIPARLGAGLAKKLHGLGLEDRGGPVIWIHALSVGEVTSALPLIVGLRSRYPKGRLILSVTTSSGRQVADDLLCDKVDAVIDGPLDLFPVICYFQKKISPDLYIQIETDFWPNQLLLLARKKIPTFLVNGRVSDSSLRGYLRFFFFFKPLFNGFIALCMQTEADREKMQRLGLADAKLYTLGNLKFDTTLSLRQEDSLVTKELAALLPQKRKIFLCGSTHPGEEEILLDSYAALRQECAELLFFIAPRDVRRCPELIELARARGLQSQLRSAPLAGKKAMDIFLLDTIGELAACYGLADFCFVGGSLVAKGGHNPIEPAAMGKPVLFGPHMEDFSEIAAGLLKAGGAVEIKGQPEIAATIRRFLREKGLGKTMGAAAQNYIQHNQGVIEKHLNLIAPYL